MPTQANLRVLVIGCGHMGQSHARAYKSIPGFEICGLVARGQSKQKLDQDLGGGHALFDDVQTALRVAKPDVVCIATYTETHEDYACAAFAAGAHVFLEKPVAPTVEAATRVVQAAQAAGKKLIVGYILRHHPSWVQFVQVAQTLGKPLVMRMNLNQQSSGANWRTHQSLMQSTSPIVDCGVHYVDVMCQMTGARPVSVSGLRARLTDDLPLGMYNYGHLQVRFDDGSVGWYEAGWGPMMSETAFFVKDVVGPRGSVSITAKTAGAAGKSDNVDAHSKTEGLLIHDGTLDANGAFVVPDRYVDLTDEPSHDELCAREQRHFLRAIVEDLDLTAHCRDAVDSLRIVLAADESARTGLTVNLR